MALTLDTDRPLGRSRPRVSPLAMGAPTFGTEWVWGADRDDARKLFDLYVERGGNFIDTANTYTNGSSERMLGEFTRDNRESLVVATKYTTLRRPGDPNSEGAHRKSLFASVEASLRKLDTDYVDLLYLHVLDFTTLAGRRWSRSRSRVQPDRPYRGTRPDPHGTRDGAGRGPVLAAGRRGTHRQAASQLARRDEATAIELGSPHDLLASDHIHTVTRGDPKIEARRG